MQTALRVRTRVRPGHRLEISAPELPEGDEVDVFVVMPDKRKPAPNPSSLMEFLDSLPPGPRSAPTWEEVEQNLSQDRESWDH